MEYSMLTYIRRQPEIMKEAIKNKDSFISPMLTLFSKYDIKRVYFLGSGTSFHVSSLGAMWFNKYLNVEASSSFPVVFSENERINKNGMYNPKQILVIGISQSGTSTSTINGIKKAKNAGCVTACYTQDVNSEIATLCDYTIPMPCEKEMVPPETQGYTAAILGLYMMTLSIANEANLIIDYTSKMMAITDMVDTNLPRAIEISEKWIDTNRYVLSKAHKISVIGANLNYITALEGALKVGETMKRVAHAYESEEFAHLVDLSFEEEDYLFAIVHDNFNYDRSMQICELTKKITNKVFIISNKANTGNKDCYFDFKVEDDLSVFYYVVPFQLIGAIIAEYLGVDTSRYPYADIESIAHNSDYFLYDLK